MKYKIRTTDPRKGRQVLAGIYDPDKKVFYKTVKSRHYCWKYKGYGISEEVLNHLMSRGCETIRLKEPDRVRKIPTKEWYDGMRDDLGNGVQIFHTIVDFKVSVTEKPVVEADKQMDIMEVL